MAAGVAAVVLWALALVAGLVVTWCFGTLPERLPEERLAVVAVSLAAAAFTGLFAWAASATTAYATHGRWPPPSRFVPIAGGVLAVTALADVAALVG